MKYSVDWAAYFNRIFIQQINAFQDCLVKRTLPSFNNLDEESEKIAEEEFARFMERPADSDDFTDPADLAEAAQDKAIDYHITMSNMKQGLIGLFTAGLFHLFEQQMFLFYNRGLLEYGEGKANISPTHWEKIKERLRAKRIDLDAFEPFKKIEILRMVANVIKHAEGKSADKLKEIKPDYFKPDKDTLLLKVHSDIEIEVDVPLSGEDLKIPLEDFNQYCEDVKDYWKALGSSF